MSTLKDAFFEFLFLFLDKASYFIHYTLPADRNKNESKRSPFVTSTTREHTNSTTVVVYRMMSRIRSNSKGRQAVDRKAKEGVGGSL